VERARHLSGGVEGPEEGQGVVVVAAAPAIAGDLVYQPVNPSFGGNPGNSGSGGGGGTTDGRDTRADLFVRQLEGRLLSALSAQVTEAIFGDTPQDQGTVEFGDTTITFNRTPEAITLDIIDAVNGTTTTITVPQLVTLSGG